MASVTKIVLDHTKDVGVFSVGISESSARAASEVLQDDLETHHIFFNDSGFHDHIVHHILTIYALGGSPDDIRAAYNNNKTYQLPAMATNSLLVQDLSDNATFMAHLGEKDQYSNYLSFFQNEIKAKGVERTIQEHIFAGTELANNMLGRLYGGLIHPLIHLGFALEFNQPAIVAQALAETAVHEDELGRMFFWPADEKAKKNTKTSYRPFLQLVNEVKEDSVIRSAVKKTDERKILALLTRAPERVLDLVAGYVVPEDKLEEATADMTNAVSYFTGAAQRPKKAVKLDFFLLHSVTCSLFFSKFISLPWLDRATKARMLEWKGRFDLLSYASRGSPDLLLDEVSAYPVTNDWRAVFSRSCSHPGDDGHLPKLVRALAHGEQVCRTFEHKGVQDMPIRGDMWLRIGNMAIDSTEGKSMFSDHAAEKMWLAESGFEESWEEIPPRVRL